MLSIHLLNQPFLILKLLIIEVFLIALCDSLETEKIDLSKIQWQFFSNSGKINGTTTIPSNIYTDLYHNHLIDEPLRGDNDVRFDWVGKTDWIYTTNFTVPNCWREYKVVLLKIDGLDTVANVWLNNELILESRNQFLSYLLPIRSWNPTNNLTVVFTSPVQYAEKQAYLYYLSHMHEVPPVCPPSSYHGECHVNFIRKMQCSFGWDWGPSFPTVGIWQPMSVIGFKTLFVDRLSATIKRTKGYFFVTAELISYSAISEDVVLVLKILELKISNSSIHKLLGMQKKILKSSLIVAANDVALWWPNGYGSQKLYELTAEVNFKGKVFTTSPIKIGFRTVVLDQSHVDNKQPEKGRNFYFKVNDVPIFLKGTNWIPISLFQTEDQSERLRFLLSSVIAGNMNAMRVWGGGRYETDELYELADQMGILLWHDFMFACALYPTDAPFLSSVRSEISQQVWRLRHHPSILVWAGNNENELGIANNWYMTFNYEYEEKLHDYMKLYNNTVKTVVMKLDDTRPYAFSSPSNGLESEKAGGISQTPGDEKFGDIHYYADGVDLWHDYTYQIPRCATEYGVQSLPAKETMLRYLNESDYNFMSEVFLNRQHRPAGTALLLANVYSHFKISNECSNQTDEFNNTNRCLFLERFTYYTQMHQALAYQMETEHYRRWRGRFDENGLGNTMCALYWQLNDVWSAPSWSSIDFSLNWKPVHYFARRFFAGVIVSTYLDKNNNLEVFVVSDVMYSLKQHILALDMFAWTGGFRPVYSEKKTINIRPQSSERIQFRSNGFAGSEEEYIIRVRLLSSRGIQVGYDSILLPDRLFKAIHIDMSHLGNVSIGSFLQTGVKEYKLKVAATGPAPLVWLTIPTRATGWFSDNAFTMVEPEKTVKLILWSETGSPLKVDEIKICSLKNCGRTLS